VLDLNNNIYYTKDVVSLPHRSSALWFHFIEKTVEGFRFTYILRHNVFTKYASVCVTYHILNFLDISLPTLATLNYMGAVPGKVIANS